MLRSSVMALAALLLAAALAPAQAGGYFGGGWHGNWDFYGGRFLVATPPRLHEYAAYNPNCAFLRRVVPTPLGPQWQLVPVCF
ncbi:MAG: sulfur globule protein precursor [Xanthobacteraceae bacterium]